jgi:hypothetical protein
VGILEDNQPDPRDSPDGRGHVCMPPPGTGNLDYRFRESCHKQGIHLSFQAPMYAGALRTKDGRLWQRGGGRLSCRSEMRMWRG